MGRRVGQDVMDSLLGLLLPLGIGAAISPIPTTICIMLLSTRKPLTNTVAFLIGYSAVLVAVGIFSLAFFGAGTIEHTERSSDIKNTIDVMFGGIFLVLALKVSLKAPDPNAPPPGWIATINTIEAGKALLFGMVMMATNFSSLPLYISGLKEIITADIGVADSILVLALFILLIEVELLVPTVAYALAPRRTGAVLGTTRQWLEKNNRVISIFVFVVFGGLLLFKGITGLWG
jgi:threonine/homoserine/homoserine lactone efflux protein